MIPSLRFLLRLAICFIWSTLPAAAAYDADLEKRVQEMWSKENFEGLEKEAQSCREAKMDILDNKPTLTYYYRAIRGDDIASDEDASTRKAKFDRWQTTIPHSVTARVALADFYIKDALRARRSAGTKLTPPEFTERLKLADDILHTPGMEIKADPSIADLRIFPGTSDVERPVGEILANLHECARLWPEYFPVYNSATLALLPRWRNQEGAAARFAQESAARFPPPKSDGVYALIGNTVLDGMWVGFFATSKFDIPRFIKGLDTLAAANPDRAKYPSQRAAFVQAMGGNPQDARRRIFDTGPEVTRGAYLSDKQVLPAWEKCGALAELDKGAALEREGDLVEAEKFYASLTSVTPNPWLQSFARRNGVSRLWIPDYGAPSPDYPVEKATTNQLFEMAVYNLCAGHLDAAALYAKAFDVQRDFNVTGKYILAAVAVLRDQQSDLEELKRQFLAMTSDRRNYRLAQDYVSGQTKWARTRALLSVDEYFIQSCSIMAVYALGEGRRNEARAIFEEIHRNRPYRSTSAFAESMLWGTLNRTYPDLLTKDRAYIDVE